MALQHFKLSKKGDWYPVIEHNGEYQPSSDPSDWQPLIERYFNEAIIFLRAVGAEHTFKHRLGVDSQRARQIYESWTLDSENVGGSHTMRTIGRIAYERTGQSAVDIYLDEHRKVKTDLPNMQSVQGVINAEVSRYDADFINTGGSLLQADPNFDSTKSDNQLLDEYVARIREEILNDPDYYTPIHTD